MDMLLPITNKIDATIAIAVAILTYIFGEHWFLFAAFLVLNVIDYITGCMKSRANGRTSSQKGLSGVLKKFGYWIMVLVGFGMSAVFIEIGLDLGINLSITKLIGWFVLASLLVNEFRSILENLVECGYNLPKVLIEGLEVANNILEKSMGNVEDIVDKDDEKLPPDDYYD